MKNLDWAAVVAVGLGILASIIASATWPSNPFLREDPTGNIIWLSLGGALISAGILAGLLSMHARAVTDGMELALARHEDRLRLQERDRVRKEERERARREGSSR